VKKKKNDKATAINERMMNMNDVATTITPTTTNHTHGQPPAARYQH
jgi:hypothetical protein